jgi:hypothetical protein
MALRTSVHVACDLPDGAPGGWFATPDLDFPFDDVRVLADRRLVRDVMMPDDGCDDLPSEADATTLSALLSRTRWTKRSEEPVWYTGLLRLSDGDRRYVARLREGFVTEIRAGGLAAWAVPGDAWRALADLRDALAGGAAPDPADLLAYLEAVGERPEA